MEQNRLIGIIGGIILIIAPFVPLPFSVLDLALMSDPWGTQYIFLIILILLIVGGIVSFFKGLIGGVIGLVGMIVFTFIILWLTIGEPIALTSLGYILGWIGSIISIASHFFKPRATPASV